MFGDTEEVVTFANTEHALVVLNHRGDLDWMIGWVFIDRFGLLGVSVPQTSMINAIKLLVSIIERFLMGDPDYWE